MKKIDSAEKIYLMLLALMVVIMLVVFSFLQSFIENLNPFLQFLFMNLGIYLMISFLFKGIALDNKVHFSSWFASIGMVLGILAIDVVLPEYHVLINGNLVSGGLFGSGATDYILGYIGQGLGIHGVLNLNFINIHVAWLWLWTYGLCVLALFITAALFTKQLIKKL